MANNHTFSGRSLIVISLEDKDNKKYAASAEDFPDIAGDDNFTLLAGVADIKFSLKSGETPSGNKKKVKFDKAVTIEINFPDDIEEKLKKYEKKPKDLQLGYFLYDAEGSTTGTWHLFPEHEVDENGKKDKVKTKINIKKRTGTVKFQNWYYDPPVGWGF